jgi:hypothetical protein
VRSGYADQNFNFRKIETFHSGRRQLPTVSNSFPLYLIWQIKYDKTMRSMVECYQHFSKEYNASFFSLEDGSSVFCQNIVIFLPHCKISNTSEYHNH